MDVVNNFLPPVVRSFEQQFRSDHRREHGLLVDKYGTKVVERSGDYDSVDFSPEELEQARNGVISHSHPRDLPPSGPDLAIAATYDLILRAFGVAPDTGDQYDYTVKMNASLHDQADEIVDAYAQAFDQAGRELAHYPYSDLQWQRESRHLALQRTAQRFNFYYRRAQRNLPLSEMSQQQLVNRQEKARLDVLSNVESVMREQVFAPLHDEIMRNLGRLANPDGRIPVADIERARTMVGTLVQRTILGSPLRDGSLKPYVVQGGQIVPRSQYFKVLWGLMREAGAVAAGQQADLMRKYLPADLVRQLEYATVSPFDEQVSEMDEGPDLTGHDPLHLWTGPDGKRLLDRLWNVAGDMYRRLDLFIGGAIARGQPMVDIDESLGHFLVDDKGSYEAMRLARTEVPATYSRVDSAAAALNPVVEKYQPFVSPSHNHVDVCDGQVAGGPYDKSDTSHLPPFHPFCLCGVMWILVEDVSAAVERLRSRIATAIAQTKRSFADLVGPLSRRFLDMIFGARQ